MTKKRMAAMILPIILILFVLAMFLWYFLGYRSLKIALFRIENYFCREKETVFLGDSLTDLCHLDRCYPDGGTLYNRGINGDTVTGVNERLESTVLPLNPGRLVLLIGINDLIGGKAEEALFSDYRALLGQIGTLLPETALFVQSLYPVSGKYAELNQAIVTFNEKLRALCAEQEIPYIDVHAALKDKDGQMKEEYTTDGLHCTAAGYRVIAPIVAEAVFGKPPATP